MINQFEKVFRYNVKVASKIKVFKKNLVRRLSQLIILLIQILQDFKQLDIHIKNNKFIKINKRITLIIFI